MTAQAPRSGTPSPIARRGVLVAGLAAVGGAALFAGNWYNIGAEVTAQALSVQDAHELALSGDILLVDIRRPDEWARTGVGEGAVPLDMRRADFVEALGELRGDGGVPVALICARGVRSKRLTARLAAADINDILDVPEGMLGSGAGPGWLRAGLPVVAG